MADCLSMVVMKARGIQCVLTADHHFQQGGLLPFFCFRRTPPATTCREISEPGVLHIDRRVPGSYRRFLAAT